MADHAKKAREKAEKEAELHNMLRDHIARQEWDVLQTKIEDIKIILRNLPKDVRDEILDEFRETEDYSHEVTELGTNSSV